MYTDDDQVWPNLERDDLWIYDKLILSRKLGYDCGPADIDVPKPGYYIVRPITNLVGLGLGAKKMWLEKETGYLPPGHFWCEWFDGQHLSVDYEYGKCKLSVVGHRTKDDLTKWDKWEKVNYYMDFPTILWKFTNFPIINCEFIGGKLIEVHFRENPDFSYGNSEYIPVWEEQEINVPEGYTYIENKDVHGRKGAYIK